MALAHSPRIATDGLVFYYDQGNVQKSWKGAPTTNLKSNPDFQNNNTGYEAYVGGTPTVVIVTDFPGNNGLPVPKAVLQCTSAAAPGGGGNSGGLSFTNPTLTAGLAYTISFWARILSHSSATNTFSNQAGSGDNSNFSFQKTITNNWVKYSFTTSSLDIMKSTWYIWTDLNSATWQYADFQIEQNTFATPFVNGTRSNTQALLDLTGRNTLTANNLTYASDGSFSFVRANSPTIATNLPVTSLPALSNFSLSVWLNITALPSVANNNGVIFGATYYSGTAIYWFSNGSTFTIYGYIRGNDAYRVTSSYTIPLNTVHHIVLTNNNSAGTLNLYVNGELFSSVATATQEYNSSLAADAGNIGVNKPQVDGGGENVYTYFTGSLYSAAIHNKALSPQEVRQNFNALRGRYGI